MKEPRELLKAGTRIVTHDELGETTGMLIVERHLNARKSNALGMIDGYVTGHGGDVYFVRHAEGDVRSEPCPVAAYSFTEFELAEPPARADPQ